MIHCICLKFGTKYSPEYVDKLFRGITRNTSKEFLFTCFTDNSSGILEAPNINTAPLPLDTGDWFSKIGLYAADLYDPVDQIFYFDLDTVIVGDLDRIFEYSGDFIILRDPYNKHRYGSGLMSWRPHAVNHMFKNFTRGYTNRRGDQGWCEEQYPNADIWQEKYPNMIISYKVHIKGSGAIHNSNWPQHYGTLDTASIVYFHGRPMPHEVAHLPWMRTHWT